MQFRALWYRILLLRDRHGKKKEKNEELCKMRNPECFDGEAAQNNILSHGDVRVEGT